MSAPSRPADGLPPPRLRALPVAAGALVCCDADGVLWEEDRGEAFVEWLVQGPRPELAPRWHAYQQNFAPNATAGCLELARFTAGLPEAQAGALIAAFWRERPPRWNPEPPAALRWLAGRGAEIWVVSASVRILLEPLRQLLPVQRILALELELDAQGRFTGQPTGITTWGPGKAEAIRRAAGQREVLLAVGDSHLDVQMLALAEGLAWAYRPDAVLAREAQARGWWIDGERR